jgi:hypothetical protein
VQWQPMCAWAFMPVMVQGSWTAAAAAVWQPVVSQLAADAAVWRVMVGTPCCMLRWDL